MFSLTRKKRTYNIFLHITTKPFGMTFFQSEPPSPLLQIRSSAGQVCLLVRPLLDIYPTTHTPNLHPSSSIPKSLTDLECFYNAFATCIS